jgi:hypothetical protein
MLRAHVNAHTHTHNTHTHTHAPTHSHAQIHGYVDEEQTYVGFGVMV